MINAYNYLVSSDYYKPQVKYNAHKKSELKNIYKDIMAISKDSPLYMFKLTPDDQSFALSIKNYAGDISSSLEQFLGEDSVFTKTVLASSNERCIQVYGEGSSDFAPLDVSVEALAVGQQNKGKSLYTTASILSAGTYKFNVTIEGDSYDFEYKVGERADNHTVQTGLADFINKANIGISASIEYADNSSRSLLVLSSDTRGTYEEDGISFHISDNSTVNGRGLIDYLGLDQIETYPSNSRFSINGTDYNTAGNKVELFNGAILEFTAPTTEPVTIFPSSDASYVLDAVENLADEYNSFIDFANNSEIKGNGPAKVTSFMESAIKTLGHELEACGITISDNGHINIDESLLKQSVHDGTLKDVFTSENGLTYQLRSRTELIGLNPMEYINKTIVTYPNVARPGIANPYLTSVYSGMLFNQYC